MKVSLAISCELFAVGIRKILKSDASINIIGETSNHSEVVSLVRQAKSNILLIDTNLIDLNLPEILISIREKSPQTRVLVMLYNLDEELIVNAISMGASGYLKPPTNGDQLIRAIKAISRGEIWAERRIMAKVVSRLLSLLPPAKIKPVLKGKLTKREEEIMDLVIQGLRNKQISNELFISESTVKAHLVNIFRKLGVNNRFQLTNLPAKILPISTRTKVV
jgi:DNA-binding NarL/FixJ family response regulator